MADIFDQIHADHTRSKAGAPHPAGENAKTGWWQPQAASADMSRGVTPETHAFSRNAWLKGNPGGDVDAATAAAKKLGFEVGD
jgi:hypothetical protein